MLESGAHRLLRQALRQALALGYTPREREANLASLYYWGRQYDHLRPWDAQGVALRDKAPAYRVRLAHSIVRTYVDHLFGADNQPTFAVEGDDALTASLTEILDELDLELRLPEIGRLGALHGMVAVGFHAFEGGRIDLEIIQGATATVTLGSQDRAQALDRRIAFDDVLRLVEQWHAPQVGEDGEQREVWHRREWTPDATIEFVPIVDPPDPTALRWIKDEAATVEHGLGFVPVVWIRNLEIADDTDGEPLLGPAEFEAEDEINYTLSQTGRGLRYNQEPTLVLSGVGSDPSDEQIRRGDGNTLLLSASIRAPETLPRAELLEIEGQGTEQALAYVKTLRDLIYETTHVVRHDPERAAGAMSGAAIERLKEPTIMMAKLARVYYGRALARLCSKLLRARGLADGPVPVHVTWPPVVPPTHEDAAQVAATVTMLLSEGLLTRRKAIELLAPYIKVGNVDEYLDELDAEEAAQGTQQPPPPIPPPAGQPSPEDAAQTAIDALNNL